MTTPAGSSISGYQKTGILCVGLIILLLQKLTFFGSVTLYSSSDHKSRQPSRLWAARRELYP